MFSYVMSPTGREFHECDSFLKMICGPYGSGKSCCCAVDILAYACAQAPSSDGIRYVRVGVIRSIYRELLSATRRSLLEVLPSECGSILESGSPIRGFYFIPLPDGTSVHLELDLIALKTREDCEALKSTNWTFAWINEATGCDAEVVTTVATRVSRYPSNDLGGISWGGLILDFNQPPPGHWLNDFIAHPKENWAYFEQPPAAFKHVDDRGVVTYEVNPKAENLRNLGSRESTDPPDFTDEQKGMRYYRNQIDMLIRSGRTDIVDNQYCMLEVPIVDGKPVYAKFSSDRHIARQTIEPEPFQHILVGMDQSGIHPAAVVVQNQRGKWCILDELYAENEGLENFIYGMLVPLLRAKYATNPVVAAIDPSNQRDSWQAITPEERLAEVGIKAVSKLSNNPKLRIQTVEHMLNLEDGGILISPECKLLIRGFQSEYRYRKLRAGGTIGAVFTPEPEKNDASHVHDALQYVALLINQGQRQVITENTSRMASMISAKRRILARVV